MKTKTEIRKMEDIDRKWIYQLCGHCKKEIVGITIATIVKNSGLAIVICRNCFDPKVDHISLDRKIGRLFIEKIEKGSN